MLLLDIFHDETYFLTLSDKLQIYILYNYTRHNAERVF